MKMTKKIESIGGVTRDGIFKDSLIENIVTLLEDVPEDILLEYNIIISYNTDKLKV